MSSYLTRLFILLSATTIGLISVAAQDDCVNASIEIERASFPIDFTLPDQIPRNLAHLKEKRLEFTHPRYQNQKFRVHIQEDIISRGLFGSNEKESSMAFVEMIPDDSAKKPYLVALATDFYVETDGTMHFGWLTSFSYKAIVDRVVEFRKELRHGNSYFGALTTHMILQPEDSLHPQMKLLYFYLRNRFGERDLSDEEFMAYMTDEIVKTDKSGIAFALAELFSNRVAAIGTTVKFRVANEETRKELKKGIPWEQTLLGRYTSKAGFDLKSLRNDSRDGSLPEVTIIKSRTEVDRFKWIDEQIPQ